MITDSNGSSESSSSQAEVRKEFEERQVTVAVQQTTADHTSVFGKCPVYPVPQETLENSPGQVRIQDDGSSVASSQPPVTTALTQRGATVGAQMKTNAA